MTEVVRRSVKNLPLIGAAISFCIDKWFTGYLVQKGVDLSWGWLGLVLLAIWLGGELRQLQLGDHWVQMWWSARQRFATVRAPERQSTPEGYTFRSTVKFLQDAQNTSIVVEVLRAEVRGFGPRTAWMRMAVSSQVERAARNRGDVDAVTLISVENVDEDERRNKGAEQWRLKSRCTITAQGKPPLIDERLFFWIERECDLLLLPMESPENEEGDSLKFANGPLVLTPHRHPEAEFQREFDKAVKKGG